MRVRQRVSPHLRKLTSKRKVRGNGDGAWFGGYDEGKRVSWDGVEKRGGSLARTFQIRKGEDCQRQRALTWEKTSGDQLPFERKVTSS